MANGIFVDYMDPVLLSINSIKDIEEIDFDDLIPSIPKGKLCVIPRLFVRYDGGKTLVLCSRDKYFDIFVKKVFEVYNQEKDRVVIDPVNDPFRLSTTIRIDERTKKMLESGSLTKVSEIYSFYDNKDSYENSLIFQNDSFSLLLPIIKYHLKEVFNLAKVFISFDNDKLTGYRNNYTLEYKIDGDDIFFDQPNMMGIRGYSIYDDFRNAIRHLNLEDKIDVEKAQDAFERNVMTLKHTIK